MSETTHRPTPPNPVQTQSPPGTTAEMSPKPDHGETSYKGSGRLTGKACIITGADSGIGRAVAIAFAREGADVLISYLQKHEEAVKIFGKNTPLRRAGQPAELAPAYVMLASDEANYMTGALVPVTGGRPML